MVLQHHFIENTALRYAGVGIGGSRLLCTQVTSGYVGALWTLKIAVSLVCLWKHRANLARRGHCEPEIIESTLLLKARPTYVLNIHKE